jgi:hypothetical protein
VGRKVRPKLPYRRWDSARDVTPVSVMAVAGGAALAHTLTCGLLRELTLQPGGYGPRDALSQRHRTRPKTSDLRVRFPYAAMLFGQRGTGAASTTQCWFDQRLPARAAVLIVLSFEVTEC